MALEIRQLIVKSQVVGGSATPAVVSLRQKDLDRLKAELLEECRRMVARETRLERER